MALMKLYEKLLISIKKSNIVINVGHIYMLLWKKKIEDSEFDSESNDVKVPSLQIVARADCTRVKLINGVPRRFRPNWIIVRVYASCLQIRSSVVRHRPEARVWVVAYSGLYESSRSKEKNKEETRKKGAARTHVRTHAFGGKSSRKQSAAVPTMIYNKQLGVYWRLRLATMTTGASKNRFCSLRRTLARECTPKFPPGLFTPHIVRFDERKRRRSDL